MRAIFELNGRKHLMTTEQLAEVINLVHKYGEEVYECKTDWSSKTETHHVYAVSPATLGTGEFRYITDALYGMGKLRGKPTT
jgi:H2-forming N5,N10-methylenetetrahydromethanopterin dehydrogenase-like enzyme